MAADDTINLSVLFKLRKQFFSIMLEQQAARTYEAEEMNLCVFLNSVLGTGEC
jgi:hypothetical protein